jgi:hypothetical protein
MAFITQLDAGWCGMIDPGRSAGIGIAFDPDFFKYLWVFQTQGGWRGLHTVIMEPCTGYPGDLAQAAAEGHCARLDAGQSVETQVTAVVFTNCQDVRHIGLDGSVS